MIGSGVPRRARRPGRGGDRPAAPGAGEVLLRPAWCGICGTDLHEYAMGPIVIPAKPHPLNGAQLPQVLGHEFSAEVLEVGPDVGTVRAGQRVSVMPLLFCGELLLLPARPEPPVRLDGLRRAQLRLGRHRRARGRPGQPRTALPDGVSDLQGALVEPAAVAAYGVDVARVRPGDTVLVTGAGPIGALAALYAAAARRPRRRLGGEPGPGRDWRAAWTSARCSTRPRSTSSPGCKEHTEGVGADAVIECSGNERALQTALAAVRSAGRISQTGLHTRAASIEPMVLSEHDITLAGTWCYPVTDWPRIIGLIARGRLPVEKVVTAQVPMADIVERGFEMLLSPTGDQVKVLVEAADHAPTRGGLKALQYAEQGAAEVAELPVPEIAADEVLVAARSVGVCHSDIELLEGRYIIPFAYPLIPGPRVGRRGGRGRARGHRSAPGDRVVGECVIGADHFGFSISGAAAEFFVARPEWLHRLPDQLSWTMGALVEPFSVAYYALGPGRRRRRQRHGGRAGRRPDRAGRGRGRARDGRADGRGRAVRRAPRGGAASSGVHTVAPEERRGAAGRAQRRRGADVVVEASGRPEVMARALELAGFRGPGRLHRHRRRPRGAGEARADPVQGAADHRVDRLARRVAGDAALPGQQRDGPVRRWSPTGSAIDAGAGGAGRGATTPSPTIKAHIEFDRP